MATTPHLVVTGMGIVSPLGVGVENVWQRLIQGQSGIRRLADSLVPDVPCKVGGLVPSAEDDHQAGFDPAVYVDRKAQKKMDRFTLFAIAAAKEALEQAGWKPVNEQQAERTATVIATGVGGFHALGNAFDTTEKRGAKRLSPFTIPAFLANLAAGWVSINHGFKGPLGAPVTACAAGVQAIGDAARLINNGEADIAVCGGAEACLNRVSLGGFAAARALSSQFNDSPSAASRPFDIDRDGFVMGEGAGILVLEKHDHALARGATPIAELTGYGTSSDAYHLTGSPENGEGAQRAMRSALNTAALSAEDIDHVNAHSTSTPVGDRAELTALRQIFGTENSPVISATKSATGHLLGAAGGIEAIFSILALRDQIIPPTLNLTKCDPAGEGLNINGSQATKKRLRHVLSNGFGFGGVNASAIFSETGY